MTAFFREDGVEMSGGDGDIIGILSLTIVCNTISIRSLWNMKLINANLYKSGLMS